MRPGMRLLLEVEDIEHHVGAAVHQHNVPSDHHVGAAGGRWRQAPLEFLRAGLHFFPQAGRKGSSHAQLLFKSWRKLVAFCQARREMVILAVVPITHFVAIVVAVVVPVTVIIATVMLAVAMVVGRR